MNLPFYKTIPYRNFVLELTQPPYPQSNGKEWSIDNRVMEDYDLFVCDKGRALFEIDGKEYVLSEGKALLTAPGQTINARLLGDDPLWMLAQHFMLYLFHKTDFFSLIRYEACVKLSKWKLLRPICYEISALKLTKSQRWVPMDTHPLFQVILNSYIDDAYIGRDINEERKSALVLRMINEIEGRYTDENLLEDLMTGSDFGYSHTANTFKKYTGISVKAFITERRLTAAKDALLGGGSVREGADAAGYNDEFYFSRIFKKYTGTSPREFRKRI